MTSIWQDRLAAVWQQEWVGRTTELALFQEALTAPAWPFPVWMVTGPPGIGKTALLQRYAWLCREAGIPTVEVDARTLDAQPIAFLQALQPLLSEAQNGSSGSSRAVFLLDHYEQLMPIDLWLRNTLFPQLPQSLLLLLASRDPPSRIWPGDPGWSSLIFLIRLGSLSREEASDYLERRGIPKEWQPPILEFAHGHPLALRLTADWALQHPDQPFHPMAAPEVVQMLRERFCPHIPGPTHQAALEACAVVRALTEDLLSDMLDSPEGARELFAWLQGLPFVESRPHGLVLDDAAREVLGADLCWRNPDRFIGLHQRARSAYIHRLRHGPRAWQSHLLLDCLYLHRSNPGLRPFLRWETTGSIWPDRLREGDLPQLMAMVERHEGQASAALAAGWLKHQPQGVTVFRASDGEAQGFLLWITIYSTGPEDPLGDPATQAARAYLEQEAPLRPGERAMLFRFWMARETYQAVSEVQTLCFVCAAQHHLSTPGLAFSFFPCADPEFWEPVFAYMGMKRIPAADFEVEGHRYGAYGHDWRLMPAGIWLGWMAEQEVIFEPRPFSPANWDTPYIRVLSRSEFDEAVREALRGFGRPEILQANPLLHTRLVLDRAGLDASLNDRIMVLQELLEKALAAWEKAPRDRKLYEALRVTYMHPAPTQEQAAERLDLPFSTYRRHLKHGIARLCQRLWEWEIGSASV